MPLKNKLKTKFVFNLFFYSYTSLFFTNPAFSKTIIPLNPKEWKELKYNSIPANKYSGDDKSLIITVDKSSSPLIYKLATPQKMKSILVEGEVFDGVLNLNGQQQGLFKNKKSVTDDYALRFGLVFSGKNKKPFIPNFLLASWVKELFSLAPKNTGIDVIYFLKVAQNPNQIGKKRFHPLSKYLFEEVVTAVKSGPFKLEKSFESEKVILGFWISANGEGTSSAFKTKLTKIILN
jgi:hypothetical protein